MNKLEYFVPFAHSPLWSNSIELRQLGFIVRHPTDCWYAAMPSPAGWIEIHWSTFSIDQRPIISLQGKLILKTDSTFEMLKTVSKIVNQEPNEEWMNVPEFYRRRISSKWKLIADELQKPNET